MWYLLTIGVIFIALIAGIKTSLQIDNQLDNH